MWRRRDEFTTAGAEILLVSFEPLERVRWYLAEAPFDFAVVADPERRWYAAFGLERAAWWRAWLSPKTLAFYARSALRGRIPGKPRADTLQLGGDFVIDAAGVVRFARRSREPADRPAIDVLLEVVRSLA